MWTFSDRHLNGFVWRALVAGLVLGALIPAVARAAAAPVVLAAAGDIACPAGRASDAADCHQQQTSDLVLSAHPDAVAPLGDDQYDSGSLDEFNGSYALTWGRFLSITHPVAGNHEYNTPGAAGYFDYFDGVGKATGPAGDRSRGYYSYDLGAWHVVALNSNCTGDDPSTCANYNSGHAFAGEVDWLRTDLARRSRPCTLVYWHHPLFNSGTVGPSTGVRGLWSALDDYGAEIVLNGHQHDYERFAPQTADGVASPTGVREFIVGTGGEDHGDLGPRVANSEFFDGTSFGALFLTLRAGGYSWSFKSDAGAEIDSGSGACVSSAPLLDNAAESGLDSVVAALRSLRSRLRHGGTVRPKVSLPTPGTVTVRILDARKRRTLVTGHGKTAAPGPAQVVLALKAPWVRAVGRHGGRVNVRVTVRTPRGIQSTRTQALRVP